MQHKPWQVLFVFLTLLALTFGAVGITPAQAAGIIRVTDTGSTTWPCGADWATACDLQTALTNAASGDEIWVKAGTHKPAAPNGDRAATFALKDGVALYGGFAGTESARSERNWTTNLTILSGDLNGDDTNTDGNFIAETAADIQGANAYHIVFSSSTNATAVLDGFVITAGQANGGGPYTSGGGLRNISGSPTLTHITFSGNSASSGGGGMYTQGGSPALTNVTFSGNSAPSGGGMFNYYSDSTPTLTNVTFSGNSAEFGGGISNGGGSSPTLTNVTFSGNSATYGGGGMLNYAGSNPTLTNVTFSGNQADKYGGGIYNDNGCNPTLTNVTFSGNSSNFFGGGMYSEGSSSTLTNVTFSGNSATTYAGGLANSNSTTTLTNVIVSGNTASGHAEIFNFNNGSLLVSYSDIPGCFASGIWDYNCGTNGVGNLDANPLLGSLGNYGGDTQTLPLLPGSPAINAGSPTVCPATDQRGVTRPQGANCDIGAFEAQNTAPTNILLSASAVLENKPAATLVGNLTATDPGDTSTFKLVTGVAGCASTNNGSFQIVAKQLKTKSVFNFEAKNSYAVCIRVTDGGGLTFNKSFTIKVTNVVDEVAKNGGFETYTGTSKIPTYWAKSSTFGALDGKNTGFKTGKYAVKIANTTAKTKTLTQTLSIPTGASGHKFTFSYYVKGTTLPATGLCQGQVLLYNGSSATPNKTVTLACGKTGTFAYTLRTITFTTTAAYTKAVIKFTYGKANSAVWFDVASLKK